MPVNDIVKGTKADIETRLRAFRSGALASNTVRLLDALGYRSDKTLDLESSTPDGLLRTVGRTDFFNRERARPDEWKSVDFLFQITDEEIKAGGQAAFGFDSSQVDVHSDRLIESYIFFAVELRGESYSRTVLADITREINRLFPMPAMIIFRHGQTLTLSVIDRRLHKRDESRDVLTKVTLIKDIRFDDPLRAHLDILYDLSLPALQDEFHFHNFVGLHLALKKRLDTDALNRKFYTEVANWYFWALGHKALVPPRDVDTDEERSIFLIRLLTRLIFCWFLQEKGLIPRDVFRRRFAEQMLKDASPRSGSYYRAFLQNLFFATLNQEPDKRGFRKKYAGSRDGNRGATNLYRYADLLKDANALEALLREVPFVNGGLFDCLDEVYDESGRPNVRLDDFSEEKKNALNLPNEIFFGEDREVDLTEAYGDARHRREHARGLIDLLSRYKFTVEESTPLEQEVALDPELLGRVFENLLASYNEDTRTTARKATGSFYTPREIVGYMVDEALVGYFKAALNESKLDVPGVEDRLRQLFDVGAPNQGANFSDQETIALVAAIDRVKILDPACGSGAFLMGALQRLVDLLQKLDPTNEHWRTLQRRRAVEETDAAFRHGDKEERKQRLDDINEVFERNTSDYGRKLYLIENCIYGVDIQPIACQIAKLRFFISLIVDQSVDREEENFGVRPLPNLEAKVVAADALVPIERPKDHQFGLLDTQVTPLRQELGEVRHKYFLARSPATKAKCRERDAELRREIAELLQQSGWSSDAARKMAEWNPYDQNTHATFFDPEWMFGLRVGKIKLDENAGATLRGNFAFVNDLAGQMEFVQPSATVESGLDIVIGNPPYIRLQTLKQKNGKLVEFLKDQFESARKGNYDVYVVFVERGLQLLKPTGNLAYILPHKFFNAQYGEPLRGLIARGKYLRHIVHFGDQQVFPGATNYVCLLFLNKAGTDSLRFVKVDDLEEWKKSKTGVEAIIQSGKVTEEEWNFTAGEKRGVFEKLSTPKQKLGDVARIFQGLVTGADGVFVLESLGEPKNGLLNVRDRRGDEHKIEIGVLKPFLQNVSLRSFSEPVGKHWLLFPYTIEDGAAYLISKTEFTRQYPNAWTYLKRHSDILKAREGGKWDTADWYAFARNQNLTQMDRPKLVVQVISESARYAFDQDGFYFTGGGNGPYYGIRWSQHPTKSLKYLQALLNSRAVDFFLHQISSPFRGGYWSYGKRFIEQLPIPVANEFQQVTISSLVDYLLWFNSHASLTKEGNARDSLLVGYFEQIINALVYELFFADELHAARLNPFELLEKERLPKLDEVPKPKRLATLREIFERLYGSKHPLRGCLHDLGSLETIRIIEGRE